MVVFSVGSVLGSIVTAVSYLNAVVGESWTRYFILLAGFSLDNAVGNVTGIYALESLIGYVIGNVFGIPDFNFPILYGISSLLIIAATLPLVFFAIKAST